MNCSQCLDNLKTDGLKPECIGCGYREVSEENLTALELYDMSCPWGELDGKLFDSAFESSGLLKNSKGRWQKKIIKIHRLIKEHYAQQESTN